MNRESINITVIVVVILCIATATIIDTIVESGFVIASDGLRYYAHLRSLAIDGDLNYLNEFLKYNPNNQSVGDLSARTPTNLVPNKYTIGVAILWTPFFFVAHLLTLIVSTLGAPIALDGYSVIYQFCIGMGSTLYGVAGIVYIYKTLLNYYSPWVSTIATTTIALATNAVYYIAVQPTMSHAMSLCLVSIFCYMVLNNLAQQSNATVLRIAIVSALMVLVRPQNILFNVLLISWMLPCRKRYVGISTRKRMLQVVLFGITFLVLMIPQMLMWKVLYGSYLVDSYQGERFNFVQPNLIDSLFAAKHGLISWTPVVTLSLIGIWVIRKKYPMESIFFLFLFSMQWYVNSAWHDWGFGHSYGARAYINCSLIFAFGLAALIEKTQRHIVHYYWILPMFIIWNMLFVTQYYIGMVPPGEGVIWIEVLSGQYEVFTKILSVGLRILE